MISKRHGFRGEVQIIRAKFRTLAKRAQNMKDGDVVKFPTWRELRQYFETMGKSMRRIWREFEPLKYIRTMEKPFRWKENAAYANAKEWNRQMKIPCCAQIVNRNGHTIAWRFPVFGGRLFLAFSFGELRRNSYFQRIVNEEIIRQTFKYNFLIRNILIRGILVPSFQAHCTFETSRTLPLNLHLTDTFCNTHKVFLSRMSRPVTIFSIPVFNLPL